MSSLFKCDLESCFLSCYAPCHVFSIINKPLHSYNYSFFTYLFLLFSIFLPLYLFKNIKAPYNLFIYFTAFTYVILSVAHFNIRRYILEYENKYYAYCVSFFLPICSLSQLYRDTNNELIFV